MWTNSPARKRSALNQSQPECLLFHLPGDLLYRVIRQIHRFTCLTLSTPSTFTSTVATIATTATTAIAMVSTVATSTPGGALGQLQHI